jgi:hypothetical protein
MEDRTKADLSTKIKQLRGEPDKVKAETEKLEVAAKAHLEAATDKLQREAWQKMEAQKRAIKGDLQEADFFEQWFELYKQVDDHLRRVEQEFENDFRRLDEHRQGLGARLRKAANEMIDGEFEEVHDAAPPEHTPDTKMPTNPATPELASLLPERSNFQAAEAPIIATTSTETPLSSKSPESESAEMPPFRPKACPLKGLLPQWLPPRCRARPKSQPNPSAFRLATSCRSRRSFWAHGYGQEPNPLLCDEHHEI